MANVRFEMENGLRLQTTGAHQQQVSEYHPCQLSRHQRGVLTDQLQNVS